MLDSHALIATGRARPTAAMDIGAYRSRLGEGATLFFAFLSGFSVAGRYIGLLLMLIAAVADPGFWRWATRRALFWIAITWTAYVLVRVQLPTAYAITPNEAADARDGLISISGFYGLVLAWWLIDRPRTLRWLLILLPAGLMLGVLVRTEPEMWHQFMNGGRFFAHMKANAAGLYSATILIGCAALGIPAIRDRIAAGARWKHLGWALGILAAAAMFLLIASKSRSSWLAALAVACVTAVLYRPRHVRPAPLLAWMRRHTGATLVAGLAILSVTTAIGLIVVERMTAEAGNWQALFTLNWEGLQKFSIGIRLALTQVGLAVITEAPWLGVGIGTTEAALQASNNPLLLSGNEHYHNLYIQITAMTGLIGLAFFLAMVTCVLRQAVSGLKADDAFPRRLARFTLTTALLFGVASLFQVRYDDPRGLVLVALLTALALVCDRARRRGNSPRE